MPKVRTEVIINIDNVLNKETKRIPFEADTPEELTSKVCDVLYGISQDPPGNLKVMEGLLNLLKQIGYNIEVEAYEKV